MGLRLSKVSRRMPVVLGLVVAAGVVAAVAVVGVHGSAPTAGAPVTPSPSSSGSELPGPDPLLRELIVFRVRYRDLLRRHDELIRRITIPYVAWDGAKRSAVLVLPRWYGPAKHPAIPLVISPHGRGCSAAHNASVWGGMPAFGPFAVINPEGQGRRLIHYSWGWRGEIDDLARMPAIVEAALPWFHVDRSRVYALGSSMGGQETLLLVALHPRLLTGAAALDSATDMAARYRAFPLLRDGRTLQRLARIEIGGTPTTAPRAYAARSPMSYVAEIAASGVPLHIWWSRKDKIVVNQNGESGRLYRTIKRLNPAAPVTQYVGTWAHSAEMYPLARLPLALVKLKLVELDEPLSKNIKP